MLQKNLELELNITSFGINGEGVAKHDGAVIFVPYALPDETVKAKIIYAKSSFYVAKVLQILKPSPFRIKPPCPYFGKCGGCDLQHLTYNKQLEFKTNLVKNNILNIAKQDITVLPCEPSNTQYYYRNKFSFPISPSGVGMFKEGSHEIITINNCLIQTEWAKSIIEIFNKFITLSGNSVYNEQTKQGLLKHLVCRMEQNQLLVCVVVNGNKLKNADKLIKMLSEKFEHFGLMLNENTLCNNVILTDKFTYLYGFKTITMLEHQIVFDVSIESFLQVNTYIANKIYEEVCDSVTDEIVVNAYSGAGLLSALLSKKAKHVYGIEIVKSAHLNAEQLIKRNRIKNVTNICGDVKMELHNIKNFNTIVLDPPRKGCDKTVINLINLVYPNKIVYVSCDSATLSRDISNLKNYKITKVKPFDMFPNTRHVETLVVLEKI